MYTVQPEPLIRSSRENWEFFYCPVRSRETLFTGTERAKCSSRELKCFTSEPERPYT